ncbi:MAG: DNA polymerase Y family protein [Gammaproteobacteria bacterium]|jgi:protein ImuB|nr:DNA polymerase Y family protein [Gammaproteobacteria bacterium]
MGQWLALHLPWLPLDLLGDGVGAPLVVTERVGGRTVVRLANAAARRQGVVPGLGLGGARALCAGLGVRERDPAREREAVGRLAGWAWQFTSQVSLEADALLLEVGRSRRLFGGTEALLRRIREGLDALGFRCVAFVAPTAEGALVLARHGVAGGAWDIDDLRRQLAALPLAGLPIDERARRALHDAGLRRLGQVLALPRPELGRRAGTTLLDWIDRLLGAAPDPRPPFEPPASYRGRLELAAEVGTTEALLFPARRLLHELAGFLAGRQLGAARLDWRLAHAGRPPTCFGIGLAGPGRDAEGFLALLRERLQRLALPAPVREIALAAEDLVPFAGRPLALLDGRVVDRCSGLLERLRARLGEDAVSGYRLVADHRPERSYAICAPGEASAGLRFPARPLWLLPEAEPMAVRDGRPWRGGPLDLAGERERIASGWWDDGGVARDYFVAVTPAGERLWVYRDLATGRWFLHGLFG